MRKTTLLLALITLLSGMFSFTENKISQANIYCFDPNFPALASYPCTDWRQPAAELVLFKESLSGQIGDNPCNTAIDCSKTAPFVNLPASGICQAIDFRSTPISPTTY